MIRFESVSKVYEDGFKALDQMKLHINEGELLVLIGPSGCGKTTTMKMINRLIEPTEGKIFIGGKEISNLNPVELRRDIGYVIQQIGLLPHMTIAQNVALVPKLKKMDPNAYMKRVDELLDLVGLDPEVYRNRYPSELSGGQQQRVGVIRALAADPPIILMDEPFSALDPISREQLQEELVKLQEEIKKTIIFVTHDMDEALKIADRICIMREGKIVQLDTPEHILRHPADDFVRSFIGEERLNKANFLPPIDEVIVKPIATKPDKGLAESIKVMRNHKVDSLLVIDKSNHFLGTIGVWEIQKNYKDETLQVKDIMRTDIPTLKEDQSLQDAIDIFVNSNIPYLPVISNDHELKGIITHASIVEVMARKYSA
ncbi:MAG: betaine/proline/choline family ABC transporter ATP-binding protein [Marinisporobacter sp.]|jgi:osmoprotectant transport system ATP-binding protein|nr:betaine/proline/choline family ABC transporter ATP-binding protein [Marinisporobacter sp.]